LKFDLFWYEKEAFEENSIGMLISNLTMC